MENHKFNRKSSYRRWPIDSMTHKRTKIEYQREYLCQPDVRCLSSCHEHMQCHQATQRQATGLGRLKYVIKSKLISGWNGSNICNHRCIFFLFSHVTSDDSRETHESFSENNAELNDKPWGKYDEKVRMWHGKGEQCSFFRFQVFFCHNSSKSNEQWWSYQSLWQQKKNIGRQKWQKERVE